jgi:isoquinoline 1-oxidoreductase beta subunit
MTTSISRRDFLRASAVGGGALFAITALDPVASRAHAQAQAVRPGTWVRIAPDGAITITVAKSEMGQGVRTSLAMLTAEEMDADWDAVRVDQADHDPKYGSQNTGGSASIRTSQRTMREAGAAIRAMLVSAAAATWGVAEAECTTEPSKVLHRPSGRTLAYGALAEKAAVVPVPAQVRLKDRREYRLVGKPRRSIITDDVIHGRAVYGIDVRLPGLLVAVIERAPVFGATVRQVDATAARQVPGVVDVVEVPAVAEGIGVPAGVAVVAGHTWAALRGSSALKVEWELGPSAGESTAGHRAAMRAAVESTGKEIVNRVGDPDAVLAGSSKVITADYELPFIAHAAMEPMNCTAQVQGSRAEIWSPSQTPARSAQGIARALGIPVENVTLHVTLMGGGFGRRLNADYSVEAALVARKLQAPVKVIWTREDDLRHDFYRPCAFHRIAASLGADGFPEAWRHRFSTPAIAATYGPPGQDGYGTGEADGAGNMAYRVANRSCEYTLLESGVPRGWWRAVHTTHTVFAVESFLDELAAVAGKDPLAYRLAMIEEVTVPRPPAGAGDFKLNPARLKGVLQLAADKAGWTTPLPAGRGRGIACTFDHLSYSAIVVEVSTRGDAVHIERIVCAADCGPVINPNGAMQQLQGGLLQALSVALHERITVKAGGVEQGNFNSYPLLRLPEVPHRVEVYFAETDAPPSGLGETAVPPLAPALANAIAQATGKRLRSLPLEVKLI